MPRTSKTLTPAAQAAFLAALQGGAKVVEAAAAAGVAVSSLYCRRRLDPAFDSAWSEAAQASSGWLYEKRPVEKARLVRAKRRVRFAGARREAFLAALATSCDTRDSAGRAGVHPATIYRHLRRDPAFARDHQAALERGYAALEVRLEQEEAAARLRPWRWVETGARPTRDFDEAVGLLRRLDRPAPRRDSMIRTLERKLRHAFGEAASRPP